MEMDLCMLLSNGLTLVSFCLLVSRVLLGKVYKGQKLPVHFSSKFGMPNLYYWRKQHYAL